MSRVVFKTADVVTAIICLFSIITAFASQDTLPVLPQSQIQDSSSVASENLNGFMDTLEKVVVTANTKRKRLMESTQSLIIIKPEEFIGTTKSVADVIAEQTGIQTRRYGGLGSFQTVSIRGVQGSEIAVFLDGIPLNSAMGGAVDLSKINPSRIAEIEVYKGVVPARFGGNSLGGVINIKSKENKRGVGFDLYPEIGAYGFKSATANLYSAFNENLNLLSMLGYKESEENFSFTNRNGTPYNLNDDFKDHAKNSQFSLINFRQHGKLYLSEKEISTAINYSKSNKHNPAREGRINRTANFDHTIIDYYIKLSDKLDRESSHFSVTPFAGIEYEKGVDFSSYLDDDFGVTLGASNTIPNAVYEFINVNFRLNLSLLSSWQPSDFFKADLFISGLYSNFKSTGLICDISSGTFPASSEDGKMALDVTISYPVNNFQLGATATGSIRALRSVTDGGYRAKVNKWVPASHAIDYAWSSAFGIHAKLKNKLTIFSNAARYSDLPSLLDKYGTRGTLIGNDKLKEEYGYHYEIGLKLSLGKFYSELAAFRVVRNDGIFIIADWNTAKPVNLSNALIYGLELTLSRQIFSFLSCELHSTLQNPRNKSDIHNYYNNLLVDEPVISGLLKTKLTPFKKLSFEYSLEYKSPFYHDFGNVDKRVPDISTDKNSIPGLFYHNMKTTISVNKHLSFFASIDNISGTTLIDSSLDHMVESGYSWILYPSNSWCISAEYSF
jgi:outer membrane cobalamin receptor